MGKQKQNHVVGAPADPYGPRPGSAWDTAPFRSGEHGALRIALEGVAGSFDLEAADYARALSVLFGVASVAAQQPTAEWRRRGLGDADYRALTGKLTAALQAAQRGATSGDAVVRVIEPTLAVLTALGGSTWTKPPTLAELIERALPDLGLRAFATEVVRSAAWEHPESWPPGGGVRERALHRVMPTRNAIAHQAPSLEDPQLVKAGWIVLLAIGHAAASDAAGRWDIYVNEGLKFAERALRGETDLFRTIEMAPLQVGTPPRLASSSGDAIATVRPIGEMLQGSEAPLDAPPESLSRQGTVIRAARRAALPLVVGLVGVSALALACVAGGLILAFNVPLSEGTLEATNAGSTPLARVCDVGLPPTRTPTDIPRWLSRAASR
ncbi:MAG: hypothetical protein OHK0013_11850 [Sandaracinaceae bacterium]